MPKDTTWEHWLPHLRRVAARMTMANWAKGTYEHDSGRFEVQYTPAGREKLAQLHATLTELGLDTMTPQEWTALRLLLQTDGLPREPLPFSQ